jgi:hypothetical protein
MRPQRRERTIYPLSAATSLFADFDPDAGATALLAHNAPVVLLTDSTSAKNLANASGAGRPSLLVRGLNGHRVVSFEDLASWLQAAAAADWKFLGDGSAWTGYFVYRILDAGAASIQAIVDTGGTVATDKGFALIYDGITWADMLRAEIARGAAGHAAITTGTANGPASGQWHVVCVRVNICGTNPAIEMFCDGHWSQFYTTDWATTASTDAPSGPLTVGMRYNKTDNGARMDLARMLFCKALHSDAEVRQLCKALAQTYGLQPPVFWNASVVIAASDAAHPHKAFGGTCVANDDTIIVGYKGSAGHVPGGDVMLERGTDAASLIASERVVFTGSGGRWFNNVYPTTLKVGANNGTIALMINCVSDQPGTPMADAIRAAYSTDGGLTFGALETVPSGFTYQCWTGGPIVEDPVTGTQYCAMYGWEVGETYRTCKLAKKVVGGAWTQVSTIANGQADARSYAEPGLYFDSFGRLVCLIRELTGAGVEVGLSRVTSQDLGATWPAVPTAKLIALAASQSTPYKLQDGSVVWNYRSGSTGGLGYPRTALLDKFDRLFLGRYFEHDATWTMQTYGSIAQLSTGVLVNSHGMQHGTNESQIYFATTAEPPPVVRLVRAEPAPDAPGGSIVSISPDIGDTGGLVPVTIIGAGTRFDHLYGVAIGGVVCSSVVLDPVTPKTKLTCLTPAKALGKYDLAVAARGRTVALAAAYDSWDHKAQGASAWWNPRDLANGAVSAWADRVAAHTFAAAGALRPTQTAANICGVATPVFNGANKMICPTLLSALIGQSWFASIVYRPDAITRSNAEYEMCDGILSEGDGAAVGANWTISARKTGAGTGVVVSGLYDTERRERSQAFTLGTAALWTHRRGGPAAYYLRQRQNNNAETASTSSTTIAPGTGLIIGAQYNGLYYGTFGVGDIAIYPADITDAIETLAQRWTLANYPGLWA